MPACRGECMDAAELPCDAVRTAKDSAAARFDQPHCSASLQLQHRRTRADRNTPIDLPALPDRDVFVQLYGLDGNLDLMLVDVAAGGACDAVNGCTSAASGYNDNRPESLAFAAAAGRSYFLVVDGPAAAHYSLSIACSQLGGCKPARAIEAGQTIQTSTTLGSATNVTQNLSDYSCTTRRSPGPEAAFFFTPTQAGNYVVRLDNPSANVDLFVLRLPDCNGTCLTQTSAGVNNARQNELVTFTADANTSYYIVVDGARP